MATIAVPTPLPSPAADAESLRNAVQGWGTDEKALVEILSRRTAAQRAEIRRAYASLYKESLLTRLHDELSGHFQVLAPHPQSINGSLYYTVMICAAARMMTMCCCVCTHFISGDIIKKAMVLLATDPAERDAKLVREALGRRGDDRDAWVLIEAACAATPEHLVAVRRAYRSLHGSSLEEDVAACSAFQEPLRKLLVSLVRSYRCAEESVDMDVAKLEAAQLAEAVRRKKQPHGGEVVRIVSTRSKSQLAATFRCYKEQHGSDIEEDMKQYSSSQFARMLKIAVWCLTSPEKHYAEVIRYSILGLGTDEDTLTRAIVSRADIDMEKIKQEYRVRFKTTVTDDVVGDTSGYYMDILLALVGKE
ncbi:annexin D3-like isoform X1 [Triticum dicoccoides]|uniref:annexin D3-like isoform X1 n=1 Tax=Triticum dicoccoides TaxID=85692 RepID=UPI00188DE87A|nr:annexin D3-like isoform X1 [Triticum dicoccoides]